MKFYSFMLKGIDRFYATLIPVHMRLFRIFMEGDLAFESGYSVDHLLDGKDGQMNSPSFPLPVIEVTEICDIFVNIDSIDFYAYVSSVPDNDVCKRFHIREKKRLSGHNNLWRFRMAMSTDDRTIYEFAKELQRMEAFV